MQLEWRPSGSYIMPQEIDHTSSPTTVYLHRNITQVERDGRIFYEYDEAKLSNFEYQTYRDELNRSEINHLTEENQMLTDCILEMSEIVYGGE